MTKTVIEELREIRSMALNAYHAEKPEVRRDLVHLIHEAVGELMLRISPNSLDNESES